MLLEVLIHVVGFGVQTGILLLALWMMIKLQGLDYNVLGLLGSAVLASALDLIPYVGHFIAVPVLYVCIAKTTRADLFPDAVFTVVVAYALMFCANLFLIGALMGELRPPGANNELEETASQLAQAYEEAESNALAAASANFNNPTNTGGTSRNSKSKTSAAEKTPPANVSETGNAALELVKDLSLKGIIKSASGTNAVIAFKSRTYNIVPGQTISFSTSKGRVKAKCEEMSDDQVVLIVEDVRVELSLR